MGWGSGNLGGAGGGLNFVVKQYAETPTGAAKENTIGVVTDTAITAWVMSAEQPAGVEGMVWIEVAAASDVAFFADRKQQVKVYPVSVSQYIGAAWTSLNAYIYQNAAWAEFGSSWKGELYINGNQWTSVTGGWSAYAQTNGSVAFGESQISLTISTGSSNAVFFSTNNMIDFSGYNTLSVNVVSKTGSNLLLFVSTIKHTTNNSARNDSIASAVISSTGTTTLDVSTITQNAYVCIGNEGAGTGTSVFNEIRLV